MKLDVREWFWVLVNAVLVLAIVFGLKFLFAGDLSFDPDQNITVSAEGKTVVVPDIATVSFSAVTEGKDPKNVQQENLNKMNAAIDFLKKQDIDAKDIKTSNYSLYPRYDYEKPVVSSLSVKPFIIGYTMTQTVTVKIRDFSKITTVLGRLPEFGINQVEGVQFAVDDEDKYLNEAREEAFAKARIKAKSMAHFAGARLGRVITFSENFGGPWPIYKGLEAIDSRGGSLPAAPMPTVEPGSQEVTVTVSVTYAIR